MPLAIPLGLRPALRPMLAMLLLLPFPLRAIAGDLFLGDIDFEDERTETGIKDKRSVFDLINPVPLADPANEVDVSVSGDANSTFDLSLWVRTPDGGTLLAQDSSDGPGQPARLDVQLPGVVNRTGTTTALELRVVPTSENETFTLEVGPLVSMGLCSLTSDSEDTEVSFGAAEAGFLAQGRTLTCEVKPLVTGQYDFYLEDTGISGGKNRFLLRERKADGKWKFNPNASGTASGDVSLDASEANGGLDLVAGNTYRLELSADKPSASGDFVLHVGPQAQDGAAPGRQIQLGVAQAGSLSLIGQRDCYNLSATDIANFLVSLDVSNASGGGKNEVAIAGPFSKGSVSKTGDIVSQPIAANTIGTQQYIVTVNNLKAGLFDYTLTVVKDAGCVGPTCQLDPESTVHLDFDQEASPATRNIDPNADVLALKILPEDAASYALEVVDSGDNVVCSEDSPGYIEACDLRSVSGPKVRVTRSGPPPGPGARASVTAGVELGLTAQGFTPLQLGVPFTDEAISGFGDRAYFAVDVPDHGGTPASLGFGYKDRSAGKVSACLYQGAPAALPLPGAPLQCVTLDDEHGGFAALDVDDDSGYLLIVDGIEESTGTFNACLGSGDAVSVQTIGLVDAAFADVDGTGELVCGASERWSLQNDREDGTGSPIPCTVDVTVKANVQPGDISVKDVTSGSSATGGRKATLRIPFAAGEARDIEIDNLSYGEPEYQLMVDPVEGECN